MARIEIRCTNEERDRWKTSAGDAGLTFSDWVKQTLDGGPHSDTALAAQGMRRHTAKKKPPPSEPDPPSLEVPDPPELSGVARSSSHPDRIELDKPISSRKAAIEVGRLIGEDQSRREGLRGRQASQQIARAKRYAAWEFDGKPVGNEHARRYDKEFPGSAVDEAVSGPTLRALA